MPAGRVLLGVPLLVAACVLLVRLAAAPGDAARPWSATVELSAPGSHAQQAQVAVDGAGDAVAVWSRPSGDEPVVQAAAHPPGGRWEAPVDLAPRSGDSSGLAQVAVDAHGDAFVVWERFRRGSYVVQAAVRPAGGAWRPAVRLSAVSRRGMFPRIAVDPRGNAIAVWDSFVRGLSTVQASARPAGRAWQRPVDLVRMRSPGWRKLEAPRIAVDATGGAVAVWARTGENPGRRRDPRPGYVEAAVRRHGRWSSPVKLSGARGDGCCADVAVDERGDAVAVWQRSPAAESFVSVVQSAAFARGRWSAPVSLSPDAELATEARVKVDAGGDATAIWNRSDLKGATSVVGAVRPAGGTWQAPVDVSPPGERASGGELAVNARGDALAVWQRGVTPQGDRVEPTGVVRSARRAPGGAWQAPVDVSAVGFLEGFARVALDPRGGAVAVWEANVGRDIRVQAAELAG